MEFDKFKLHTMAGAAWNLLDDTGRRRVIVHGNDLHGDFDQEDIDLAKEIVRRFNGFGKLEGKLAAAEKRVCGLIADKQRLNQNRKDLRKQLNHLQRKIDHGCAGMSCSECDK